jgi:signal transduction histidine kinase
VREGQGDGAWVVVRVQDQGPGIAPAVLNQFMARFVRGQQSKRLGLGLDLAPSIAHAHGGTLTVESTLGAGTTFQLAVPVATS